MTLDDLGRAAYTAVERFAEEVDKFGVEFIKAQRAAFAVHHNTLVMDVAVDALAMFRDELKALLSSLRDEAGQVK